MHGSFYYFLVPPPRPSPFPRCALVLFFSSFCVYRYSLVLHVILFPVGIGNLTYYVPVMDAGDDLAHGGGGVSGGGGAQMMLE